MQAPLDPRQKTPQPPHYPPQKKHLRSYTSPPPIHPPSGIVGTYDVPACLSKSPGFPHRAGGSDRQVDAEVALLGKLGRVILARLNAGHRSASGHAYVALLGEAFVFESSNKRWRCVGCQNW